VEAYAIAGSMARYYRLAQSHGLAYNNVMIGTQR